MYQLITNFSNMIATLSSKPIIIQSLVHKVKNSKTTSLHLDIDPTTFLKVI